MTISDTGFAGILASFCGLWDRLDDHVGELYNEEAAVAAHVDQMDLAGTRVTVDVAHTTKANCRQLTRHNGADYLLRIGANHNLRDRSLAL